jgi:hypothetical protein
MDFVSHPDRLKNPSSAANKKEDFKEVSGIQAFKFIGIN